MSEKTAPTEPILCPSCGEPMQILSALDGDEQVAVCGSCSDQPPIAIPLAKTSTSEPISPSSNVELPAQHDRPTGSRIRILTRDSENNPPERWPEELLEDLPEETRELLQRSSILKDSGVENLSEEYKQSLRAQGYVITEDARGIRITGAPKGGGTADLSPTDLVRMAAELDGGVLPEDKRIQCPQCQATIPPNAQQCQWCGHVL
jgi:hypothetical protein